MKKRVCILTAGKGTRLGCRSDYFNKSLLRVGNKAVISHTIDAFPKSTEFVIGLGYKGDLVKQYLQIAHPDNKFIFVEIDKYSEPGAGPGYALLKCENELQSPFYFVSCDALIEWDAALKCRSSWAGIASVSDPRKYCTVDIVKTTEGFFVGVVYDKSKKGTKNAFVGAAFISEKDLDDFWDRMRRQNFTVEQEIQVAPVILETNSIKALKVRWYDTGCEDGLQKARKAYKGIQNLDKLDEELYIVDNYVIKYFHNTNIVRNRLLRGKTITKTIPEVVESSKNFYKYKFIEGVDFFQLKRPYEVFEDLLKFTQENLWGDVKKLDKYETLTFRDTCKKFYFDKTMSRLEKLFEKIEEKDKTHIINKRSVPTLEFLFNRINWDYLSDGIPAKFHGDYTFSNIIYTVDKKFKFLDWRQDFGGSIEYGDIYYDFAKMYHAFLVPHPSIKENKFYVKEFNDKIKTFIEVPYEIELSKDVFESFIFSLGYDFWKIKVLTAIVLLNMSPLHEEPIDKYLYYFAKYFLYETLDTQWSITVL